MATPSEQHPANLNMRRTPVNDDGQARPNLSTGISVDGNILFLSMKTEIPTEDLFAKLFVQNFRSVHQQDFKLFFRANKPTCSVRFNMKWGITYI